MASVHSFGAQMKAARIRIGITQESLARRTGLALWTINSMEAERHPPSLKSLLEVVRALRGTFVFQSEGTPIYMTVGEQ